MAKIALITGGARGIGLGIATELAVHGWSLMLNGVRPVESVQSVLDDLKRHGSDVAYCSADISDADDRQRLVSEAISRFGRIDALINNAGIAPPERKDILEAGEDSFDRVLNVNLKGPYFLTQLVARTMVDRTPSEESLRPSIVFVTSISAEVASTNRGDYCLSKSALSMAVKLWAARLAEHNIDVFEVRPGIIRSDMTSTVTEKYDRLIADGLTLERRWGEPGDVGKAVRALVDGEVPYATGQVLTVDGGMTLRRL